MYFKEKDNTELLNFYKDQVENNFFEFWNKAVDRENGGIFTCFNNSGTELISKNKYTWSQGRFVWIWSRLYELSKKGILSFNHETFAKDLEKTVIFLEKHVYMDSGNCVFLTDEKGNWLESVPGQGYDTSFYADCFVELGFSEYARVFKNKHYAELALETYWNIHNRLLEGKVKSEPYGMPAGYRFHSVPMIMLNVTEELAQTLNLLKHENSKEIEAASYNYMREIMESFYNDEDGRIIEVIGPDTTSQNNVLCRHFNPGHAIEDMWFVMHLAKKKNRTDYINKAVKAVKKAIKLGWDNEYGGLFRFVDMKGGMPLGERTGDDYEKLILNTWHTKLWWPHSEMLYAVLLSYELTKDNEFIKLYNTVHDYVFKTFPNADKSIGEWIQIRDRKGNPVNKTVALPVKDPYHILRNMILIIELLTNNHKY